MEPIKSKCVEYRFDHDEYAYSKEEFLSYYGGLNEWDSAEYSHTWYPKNMLKKNKKIMKHIKKDKKYMNAIYDEIQDLCEEMDSLAEDVKEIQQNWNNQIDEKLEYIYQIQNSIDEHLCNLRIKNENE